MNNNPCSCIDIEVEIGANEKYHASLQGRDEANQHPISAITDLTETLAAKQDTIEDLEVIREGAAKGETAAQPNDIKDSQITIERNSVSIGSFTLNQSSGETINILVPTTASDVGALPDSTKYAAAILVQMNPSTFVITFQLKDQDGNNIGVSQSIDIPLESVVVGGRYDDSTKKVILTLENGQTVEFSVADLVAGLQSEITNDNKLSADLVDDTSTIHKFVSAQDKTTWNNKQDALIEGSNIKIQNNVISTQTDNSSISTSNGKIQTIGVINVAGNLQTDWSGTTSQYLQAVESGIISANTVCILTDA